MLVCLFPFFFFVRNIDEVKGLERKGSFECFYLATIQQMLRTWNLT